MLHETSRGGARTGTQTCALKWLILIWEESFETLGPASVRLMGKWSGKEVLGNQGDQGVQGYMLNKIKVLGRKKSISFSWEIGFGGNSLPFTDKICWEVFDPLHYEEANCFVSIMYPTIEYMEKYWKLPNCLNICEHKKCQRRPWPCLESGWIGKLAKSRKSTQCNVATFNSVQGHSRSPENAHTHESNISRL